MSLTAKKGKPEQEKITLPENFYLHLTEVIDPSQSIDYQHIGSLLFPIQVLPCSLESKILRLASTLDNTGSNFDTVVIRSVGEICQFYRKELDLGWPERNGTQEEIDLFYHAHLDRLSYNDTVKEVVQQIIDAIKWKPLDKDKEKEYKRYEVAAPLQGAMSLHNLVEHQSATDVSRQFTTGMIELIKLSNMINNDKMKRVDPKKESESDPVGEKMSSAKSMEEYMAGMAEQGINLSDFF